VPKKLFLTKIVEQIYQPETIQEDYVFEFASSDETYHIVHYRYVHDFAGIPFFILIPSGILLVMFAAITGVVRSTKRNRTG
jgi:hypothetical protein